MNYLYHRTFLPPKPELSANAASSAVTLQVENLAANPNYTYVPYGAFFNDYYQVLGGDGALAGQSVQQDIFSCYPRKQLEETLEDWNETKQQESTLDQAESAYAAYVQAHCSSLPENLSFLQEKFDLDLETKESADPKEAEKNWEKTKMFYDTGSSSMDYSNRMTSFYFHM